MTDKEYKSPAVDALVTLHAKHLSEFVSVWESAKAANIILPKTNDSDYLSMETLLFHVLRSSGNYLIWICKNLDLESPGILSPPDIEIINKQFKEYVQFLLNKWSSFLINLDVSALDKTFKSNWGVQYSIDAMLEHAVMHPIRHSFQLQKLIERQKK